MPRNKPVEEEQTEEIANESAESEPKRWVIGNAEYEPVGVCAVCGVTVYNCVTEASANNVVGNQVAVYCPAGKDLKTGKYLTTTYCQPHDPNIAQRLRSRVHKEGDPIPAELYSPGGTLF